jgi:hypothetical protein
MEIADFERMFTIILEAQESVLVIATLGSEP